MKRSHEQLDFETRDGKIFIWQQDQVNENPPAIVISGDQIVQLIEWLREAREEFKNGE